MTGSLIIRMKNAESAEVALGAVVTLQLVSAPGKKFHAESERHSFSLTPEQGIAGRSIDLTPGRWHIEATLGSGDIISEIAEVADGEQAEVMLPPADTSPHEWLGWQFNNGNVEGRAALIELVSQAKELAVKADEKYRILVRARMLSSKLKISAKNKAASVARGLDSVRDRFDPDGKTSRVILSVQNELNKHAAIQITQTKPIVRISAERYDRSGKSAKARWQPFLDSADESGTTIDPFRYSPEENLYLYRPELEATVGIRRFIDVKWDGEHFTLALPEPWRGILDGCDRGGELLVRRHPLDLSLRVSLAVLDSDFSTMSGMMMTSAMPKAAIFVEEHADKLFAGNSFASAAAAYILLSSGKVDGSILNLVRKFEMANNIPDAAAVAAWRMIRFPEANQPPVRPAILRAFEAGPPFLSIGIGWLLDSLTMLGPDDDQAVVYANIVKRVAIKLDTTQVFTTVRQHVSNP